MTETTTTALVTGANKGIGYAVAAGLAARGMTVLLGSRDRTRGEQAAARLRAQLATGRPQLAANQARAVANQARTAAGPAQIAVGQAQLAVGQAQLAADQALAAEHHAQVAEPDVRAVVLDVTDPATIEAVAGSLDRLDVLVNNAGISGPTDLTPSRTSAETMREVFETNVIGVLMVTNALLPLLRRSPAPRIVNVSSGIGSLRHHTDPAHYMAALPPSATYPPSKTALNALTVQYAKELRADGFLVNAAAPGPCATDLTKGLPFAITRTAADGAAVVIRLATLGPDGPTGGFFDEDGPVPW
ncbi:SDR family NAD(P)-dependent oxidoreductase [[Actinomadura] parvosata]|uniref:SDR family NAD(P)-dependent oxidoreductase n=1 Tax=[Actinomadura] parvosata TaxID=1955412 RepID=UPI00406CBD79